MTIMRGWRGRAKPEKAAEVIEHYRTHTKSVMATIPGFISATVGSRDIGGLVEYILISYWADYDAVKLFVGHAPEKAVMTDGIAEVLEDTEQFVRLFEVLDQS